MKKVVLVTGGSRGIGKACCVAFAKAGYDVVFNYVLREDEAQKTADECEKLGVKCIAVKCDVSDETQVQTMFKRCMDTFGKVDVLVNNAGVSSEQLFGDFSKEEYDRVFGTNVFGMMCCAKEAQRMMLQNHDGRIINISSMWGVVGASCEVVYSASKAAVIGFTKALAKELGPSGITVNCIAPGVIDTDMNKCYDAETMESLRGETPLMRIGQGNDIANAAVFLASDNASFITGDVMNVNGGYVI